MNAIEELKSPRAVEPAASNGTVSHQLDDDRRNSELWVPNLTNYGGGDLPLFVGLDSE